MTSKFEIFSNKKMDDLYLTESMQTYLLQISVEYWDEVDTPYPGEFDFLPDWLLQY